MITRNADYLGEARSRLLEQFTDKPRIDSLLKAWSAEAQQLEDEMWDFFIMRLLQNMPVGDLLDKLGGIVGQPRNGSTDDEYRVFIQARIRANRSDAHRETLIEITEILVGALTGIQVRELYPPAIEIEANDVAPNAFIIWHDFLHIAKAAGVRLDFIFSKRPTLETLRFGSSAGGVTLTTTQRFGSVYTGGIGGGVIAGVFGI